jgi:formyl-CoA transferase
MVVEMEHPVEGIVRSLGIPVKLSETPAEIRRPAPLLGEHTEETLAKVGYSKAQIADLRMREVI